MHHKLILCSMTRSILMLLSGWFSLKIILRLLWTIMDTWPSLTFQEMILKLSVITTTVTINSQVKSAPNLKSGKENGPSQQITVLTGFSVSILGLKAIKPNALKSNAQSCTLTAHLRINLIAKLIHPLKGMVHTVLHSTMMQSQSKMVCAGPTTMKPLTLLVYNMLLTARFKQLTSTITHPSCGLQETRLRPNGHTFGLMIWAGSRLRPIQLSQLIQRSILHILIHIILQMQIQNSPS